jgi:hypothetical protein
MARKVINRKELRAQAEAAEALESAKPTKKKKAAEGGEKASKKAATKRVTKKKVVKEARMKAYWGVFTQSMKRVVVFEYADKKAADKKAAELSGSSRAPHFVQLVKEPITE